MLDKKEETADPYAKLNGTIETDDAEIRNAQSVYAKHVLEILVDSKVRTALLNHENAGQFKKGVPFKVKTITEIKYE